ncbi:MAG: N-acetyl-gamma-glutamyl-phosphate reductase, partial [Eggerthellaceae bacterium]|nr:N-acetyl-gamma-glutamyl-phosphate reductase [Eggerthellaceae bacterium]
MKMRAGVVGAAGFAGIEAVRLLLAHPEFELVVATSNDLAGKKIAESYPAFSGVTDLKFTARDEAPLADCDVVFFATPHGVAMAQAQELIAAGTKVIDLAADFRLQDVPTFERWYKIPHTCPDILAE